MQSEHEQFLTKLVIAFVTILELVGVDDLNHPLIVNYTNYAGQFDPEFLILAASVAFLIRQKGFEAAKKQLKIPF